MASTFIQFRADEEDKKEASNILNALGTNLSAVLNMTVKQIIIQRGIPFEVRIPNNKGVKEVAASMAMEEMPLSNDEVEALKNFQQKSREEQEKEIQDLISKNTEKETKSA